MGLHMFRVRLAEVEQQRLKDELAALRAEHEQVVAVLARYRAETEGQHQAIQNARERLRRIMTAFDDRVAQARRDAEAQFNERVQLVCHRRWASDAAGWRATNCCLWLT